MLEGECLVFVEVRVRRPSQWSDAAESVGPQKQRKLVRAAELFVSRQGRFVDAPMRFDVVAIDLSSRNDNELDWIRDAFRPS